MNLKTLQKAKELESKLLELRKKLELYRKAEVIDGTISLYNYDRRHLLEAKLWKEEVDLIISDRIKHYEENISRLEHELKIL